MMLFVRTAAVLATITGLATIAGLASPAQAQLAQIRVIDGDGAPVGLTSVVVRPVGSDAAIARRLTSSAGTLTHPIPDGPVVITARHVGFRADSVQVLRDTLRAAVTLRLVRIPQQLAVMVVRESQDCALSSAPASAGDASLWDEVVKGIESRRLLREAYRYERRFRRVVTMDPSVGATRNRVTDSVEINDPRRRDSTSRYRDGSYTARSGSTLSIRVFDEGDLIDESFAAFHCHGAPWRDSADGSVRIAFAPRRDVRGARDANRVRGVAILDGSTWLTRSVTYEYVRDGKAVGHGQVEYTTMSVDNSPVAMPTRMVGDFRVSGRFGLSSMLASWTIDQTFTAFVRGADSTP
jgi:hypothetical protein